MPDPKKNVAYNLDVSLIAQASRPSIKTTPTLAAGDVKVTGANTSADLAALANITTLPAETPAASGVVKVLLSAAEMNFDRIIVRFVDAAGAEWDDLVVEILTTTVTVDDVVRATTPANTLDVSAAGEAGIDWANVGSPTTAQVLSGTTVGTLTTYTGNTVQTGDSFARIGATGSGLTTLSTAAALATVQTDTDDIQTRLPAALTAGGNLKADIQGINGSTDGVAGFERATLAIGVATVGTGSTITSIVTSSITPAAVKLDQFKGQIVCFGRLTTTLALRDQKTDITSSSATGVLTVVQLTDAPVSGDTFTIQ